MGRASKQQTHQPAKGKTKATTAVKATKPKAPPPSKKADKAKAAPPAAKPKAKEKPKAADGNWRCQWCGNSNGANDATCLRCMQPR